MPMPSPMAALSDSAFFLFRPALLSALAIVPKTLFSLLYVLCLFDRAFCRVDGMADEKILRCGGAQGA